MKKCNYKFGKNIFLVRGMPWNTLQRISVLMILLLIVSTSSAQRRDRGQYQEEAERRAEMEKSRSKRSQDMPKMPKMVTFEKNVGQVAAEGVEFMAKDAQATHYFKTTEVRSVVANKNNEQVAYTMKFVEPNQAVTIEGRGYLPSKLSYHKSDKSYPNVPLHQGLDYTELWQGVNATFYEQDKSMKYDFIVQPETNPSVIQFKMTGVTDLQITKEGDLQFTTPLGILKKGKPYSYQKIGTEKVEIESAYRLEGDIISFEIGEYDRTKTLVIDPIALLWSTFLADDSYINDMYVHPTTKNIYLVGLCYSSSYPNTLGAIYNNVGGGSSDGFIICLSADGTTILWSTYIGGSASDEIIDIELNAAGDIFLSGQTRSFNFPVNGIMSAYDNSYNGSDDAFIIRLSPDGTTIKYGTFMGTYTDDTYYEHTPMVVNGDKVYCAIYGRSNSLQTTANAYQTTLNNYGAYIFCINTTIGGNAGLAYATFLTAEIDGDAYATDMGIDAMGNIYVMCVSYDDFPPTTANAAHTQAEIEAINGVNQYSEVTYVAKFDPTLSNLLYGSVVSPLISKLNEYYGIQYYARMEVDPIGNIYCSSTWGFYDLTSFAEITPAANIQQLNIMDTPFLSGTSFYLNILCKIPAANPSQYEFVNVFSGNSNYEMQAPPRIDNQGRIHYFYQVESGKIGGVTTTAGALQPNLPISPNNNYSTAMYTMMSPSGAIEYSTVLGADAPNSTSWSYIVPTASFVTDDCKVYLAGWYDRDALRFPVTPTYHDFETGTQKTVYDATPFTSDGGFLTVFHEPTPTNTITDFALGNNTFCAGGLIYQNPNEGPIEGQPAGYLSGDGSSATHTLPDISRNGTPFSHPIPGSSNIPYQWEKSYDNGTTWQAIFGANLEKLKPEPENISGTIQYRRAINGYCDTVYSNVATANVAGDFNLIINAPTTPVYYCEGSLTNTNITITGTSGNISWQWYNGFAPLSNNVITPSSGSGTSASFTASIATSATGAGYYRLVVTDVSGCKREGFVTIAPLTAAAASGSSVAMCPTTSGGSVTLGPNAVNPDFDYQWSGPSGFTSNAPNPTVNVGGAYVLMVKLKAQSTYCATGQTQVNVPAFQAFDANLTSLADIGFCQDESPGVIGNGLTAPVGYVFQWSPGINLDDLTIFNPSFDPGELPFGIKPVSSVEYTFTALRLSDGCIFETTMTVTDTARAFADAGIDQPACGLNPSGNFGAPTMDGSYFQWRPVATTYSGGISALTSHPQWTMNSVNTATSYTKFLSATFPSFTAAYTIDFEVTASYTTYPNGCKTRDTVRLFYNPDCGSGDWCTPLTAKLSGTNGSCSGSNAWIEGSSLGGLTHTWTTYSVNGFVQPPNTAPQGLFEYNSGAKGNQLVNGAAHPSKVIVDFDDPAWGWTGANVVVYRLTTTGNFGGDNIDCHQDIQVFSAENARPVVGVIDNRICSFPAPGVRFGTNGQIGPYIVTGSDYTTAPNSNLIWEWGQVNSNTTPFILGNGSTPFPTLDPTNSTDFWVKVEDPLTGCTAYDTMTMNVVDVVADAGYNQISVCQNSLVQIGTTARANHTYSWTPTAGLNDPIGTPNSNSAEPYLIAPNAPTGIDYALLVTETITGCQATDTITITTNTNPPPTPSNRNGFACGGESFFMSISAPGDGLSFSWSAGAGADLAWLNNTSFLSPMVTLPSSFSGSAVFILTVSKGSCGSTSATYTINDIGITIDLGPDQTASCTTPYIQIGVTASSGYTYSWAPFDGLYLNSNGTIPYTGDNYSQVYAAPNTATTYTLTATRYSSNCFASDDITISPPSGISADAGVDKTWCPNSAAISVGNSATGASTWSAIGYSSNPNGTPTTPTAGQVSTMMSYLTSSSSVPTNFSQATIAAGKYVYRLTVVNAGCTITDDVTIIVPNVITDLSGPSQSVCLGESVQIGSATAPPTYNYIWSAVNPISANNTISNRFIARPIVTPTTTTTYQLTYNDINTGCSFNETIVVSITPKPTIADATSSIFCGSAGNQNLTTYIPTYSSYFNPVWYKNAVAGGILITSPTSVGVNETTNFYLIAENDLGCKDTAQVTINVQNPQTPTVPSNALTNCSTKTLNLVNYQGSPSNLTYTLEWHNANNTNAASLITNTVVGVGTYYLFEKSPTGCYSGSDEMIVVNNSACVEICNDGIDNDGDFMIDCDDMECPPPMAPEIIRN